MVIGSPATSTTVAGVADFFDRDQRHQHAQIRMRENASEVQQFIKEIKNRSGVRAPSPIDFFPVNGIEFDQSFANNDRLYHVQLVTVGQQVLDLGSDRRQAAALYLHQPILVDHVDPVAPHSHFYWGICFPKVLLQLLM